jgi:hypothetical protein
MTLSDLELIWAAFLSMLDFIDSISLIYFLVCCRLAASCIRSTPLLSCYEIALIYGLNFSCSALSCM